VCDNDCFKKTLLENNQNNFLIYIYIHAPMKYRFHTNV
jgi:hypothetical protein